jgi:hypothetical protein
VDDFENCLSGSKSSKKENLGVQPDKKEVLSAQPTKSRKCPPKFPDVQLENN